MTMAPPVRYALLRDGPAWAIVLPPTAVVADDDSLVLANGATSAVLESGRLDAGVDSDWERVAVQAQAPADGDVFLDTFTSNDANATPGWRREPGLNVLLDRDSAPAPATPGTRRYLWLRITLNRLDDQTSPALRQVQAQTIGRGYIEDLPTIYRRNDQATRFLQRWLDLFRSDMEGFEQALSDVPVLFDPRVAPADQLDWVAQCLGFEPPPDLPPALLRELLLRVPALYERRGTVAGLEDWAEVYTGLRPTIVEAYRARRVWQLDSTSLLGFDTMLAASASDGLVVPGTPLTDPGYVGLLRETFGGPAFDWVNASPRIDASIDFISTPLTLSPVNAQGQAVGVATLRWSGQIKPRYPERYTLLLQLEGAATTDDIRVRLWIDGMPLIEDLWADASASVGQIPSTPKLSCDVYLRMEEPRWYPLRLEVRTTATSLKVSLSWSSRSQRPEIVPSACLYALADERADTSLTQASGFDVGSAVVGATGPQTPDEFGQGLFSETAHLFTVLVPPARDCDGERHRRMHEVIDAEKPAHTDYHLCFLKPRMRVGFQARLGIDAIVADGPPPARLDETSLGRNSFLAATGAEVVTTQPSTDTRPLENASWTR